MNDEEEARGSRIGGGGGDDASKGWGTRRPGRGRQLCAVGTSRYVVNHLFGSFLPKLKARGRKYEEEEGSSRLYTKGKGTSHSVGKERQCLARYTQ